MALVDGRAAHGARPGHRRDAGPLVEPDLDTDARGLLLTGLRAEADEADAARAAGDGEREAARHGAPRSSSRPMRRHVARVRRDHVDVRSRPSQADCRAGRSPRGARARPAPTPRPGRPPPTHAARSAGRSRSPPRSPTSPSPSSHERRRDDAAAALAEAHAIAVALEARPLREAIEAIARRARIGLDGVDSADDAADRIGLTPREREVLSLLAEGRTNRQIGDALFMAESTAGVHVSRILSKLGVRRRSEAAVAGPPPRAVAPQLTMRSVVGTWAASRSTTSSTSASVL